MLVNLSVPFLPLEMKVIIVQASRALSCFADTAFFYKLKVCGNSILSKSNQCHFLNSIVRFVSLCHILVILMIFQTFSLLFYGDLQSVFFDVTTTC